MSGERSTDVEARERAYFDEYYAEQGCHPLGLALRLRRDLYTLRKACGMRPIGRVLSVGCGEGSFELLLAPHAEAVLGIDLAEPGIARARERAESVGARNLVFQCTPAAELARAEQFDVIVCLGFLHHLPEAEVPAFLARLHEQLLPGGFLYTQDPNIRGVLRKLGRVLLGRSYHSYHSPDERELDPHQVEAALRAAGFDDVRLGYHDLTLAPLQYYLPKGPGFLMHVARAIDAFWSRTPLSPWSSGFYAVASKAG